MTKENIPSRYVTRYYMEIDMENNDKGKVCCINVPAGTTCSPVGKSFKVHPSWDGITPEEKGYMDKNPILLSDRVVTTRRVRRADS